MSEILALAPVVPSLPHLQHLRLILSIMCFSEASGPVACFPFGRVVVRKTRLTTTVKFNIKKPVLRPVSDLAHEATQVRRKRMPFTARVRLVSFTQRVGGQSRRSLQRSLL